MDSGTDERAEIACECGHSWVTKKPLQEIERIRCSECGNTDKSTLQITPLSELDMDSSTKTENSSEDIDVSLRRIDIEEDIEEAIEILEDCYGSKMEHQDKEVKILRRKLKVLKDRCKKVGSEELDKIESVFVDLLDDVIDIIEEPHPEVRYHALKEKNKELERKNKQLEEKYDETKRMVEDFEEDKGMSLNKALKFVKQNRDLVLDKKKLKNQVSNLKRSLEYYQ